MELGNFNFAAFFVGILVCVVWLRIILDFKRVIGRQFEQLREMEKYVKGRRRMHTKEWNKIYLNNKGGREFSFSSLEAQMPSNLLACILSIPPEWL